MIKFLYPLLSFLRVRKTIFLFLNSTLMIKKKLHKVLKLRDQLYLNSISGDLTKLALFFGTDKITSHSYIQHYEDHFHKFKKKEINLLEIGVGGYSNANSGGHSLRMWKHYFKKGNIFGIDIHEKSALEENRIKIFKGSQVDNIFLNKLKKEIGELDLIIDDGSHQNEHVIKTFQILFPYLNDGGIYVVEDTQTSYWPEYGGTSEDLQASGTIMNFFKGLTDSLNHMEFIRPGYEKSYFDQKVISIHFYHNLIFIYKGNNDENSNIIKDNKQPKIS